MPFSVLILGCGSATPTLNHNPSSQLVNIEQSYFLVDCGEGTQLQLRKEKIRFQRIQHIFISHLHGDHFFGLIGLISTYQLLGRKTKLTVYSPPGLKEIILQQLKATNCYLSYELVFIEIIADKLQLLTENKTSEVFAFPLKHHIPCYGFLFKEKVKPLKIKKEELEKYDIPVAELRKLKQGVNIKDVNGNELDFTMLTEPAAKPKSYAYCTDTVYLKSTSQYAKDVDVLYHEATFDESLLKLAKMTMHSTASQAGKVAKEANAKKLVIGHFSSRYKYVDKLLKEAQLHHESTILADEGLRITL